MPISVTESRPSIDEALELYSAVGWSAYTDDPESLTGSIAGSHRFFCARGAGNNLVGLARTISDGHTIVYLQDILVHPEHHRSGIGRELMDAVLAAYEGIRQFVLLTDDEPGQRAFYESCGLTEVHDVRPHSLRAFVRFG